MRIQFASDLHLELLGHQFPGETIVRPARGADLLVLAGDIARGNDAIDLFGGWPVPIVYVCGNHEFYHEIYETTLSGLRMRVQGKPISFLNCDRVDFDDIRILGCTLWTDYLLMGGVRRRDAMSTARRVMRDHKVIRMKSDRRFLPEDALNEHELSSSWLLDQLGQNHDGLTVVVTHHAPHPHSIHERYTGDLANAGFASDLTPLIEKANLWIHGHVHDSFDYLVGKCRVVANPRGYALNRATAKSPGQLEWENPAFDPELVIEL